MKFSKLSGPPETGRRRWGSLSQLILVSSIGLVVATLLTACQLVTIDYVFLASSAATTACSGGEIETFASDSQSGALRTAAKAVCAGGVNPVAMAVTANYSNLYVANHDDNTVVHFAVATNGVLTAKDTVTLSTAPKSLAVNAAGTFLYVVSGDTSATLTEYALSSTGTIGAATAQENLLIPGFTTDSVCSHRCHGAGQQQRRLRNRVRSLRLQSRRNHDEHRASRLGLRFCGRLRRRADALQRQPLPGRREANVPWWAIRPTASSTSPTSHRTNSSATESNRAAL